MFLPQRPYLPLGSLRAAVCYPSAPDTFSDREVQEALVRCGLEQEQRWDRTLSLGQQQRVAFARLLMHRPKWVYMDEATSALDDENEASMPALFDHELAGASVLSIGHRPGLEAFHSRTPQIRKTSEGAVLLASRTGRLLARSRWIERIRDGRALGAIGRGTGLAGPKLPVQTAASGTATAGTQAAGSSELGQRRLRK